MNEQISPKTPLVNIVMATFNPRMDWLKEQLQSLNEQTYKNIIIYIRDDCSDKVSLEEIKAFIKETITNFPYSIQQNAENIGSNRTFEKLTEQAEGQYIAYCDQDDIWLPEKIQKLVDFIQQTNSQLVCSDVYVIDTKGKTNANSITGARKRHVFKEGGNLANDLLFRNFVIGCTMLMPTKLAKDAMPFVEDMVHDHYLALYASTKGSIDVYKENLIRYRIHESNQTNILSKVSNKATYYQVRIKPYLRRMEQLKKRFDIKELDEAYEWAQAREVYYQNKSSSKALWHLRHLDKNTTIFELVMLRMPSSVFNSVLTWIQRGKV
ncbi:glycosyltransferase [Aminipila sp.]|uniref:glycosyltransferase n=1 Tax=Aminipila sp. TaxID=2060095 RepID=UPI00289FF099|nr:glycosyltransferase [Aminipila sp.]